MGCAAKRVLMDTFPRERGGEAGEEDGMRRRANECVLAVCRYSTRTRTAMLTQNGPRRAG